MDQVNLYFDMI